MFIAFEQDAELSNKLIFEVAPNLDQLENSVDKPHETRQKLA